MHPTVVDLLGHNADHAGRFRDRFDDLQDSQHPDAVTVCCSDSRVLSDHMWGNDVPGRLFSCGNIGNRVVQRTDDGDVISGDVLYPILHAGTDVAIVVGHTGCGAVTATYDDLTRGLVEPPGIERCLDLLRLSVEAGLDRLPPGLDRPATINRLVEYNVDRQVGALTDAESVPDAVTVVGAVYDFQDVYSGDRGEVHVINVDGERDVATLREEHQAVASRIDRLWAY